LCMLLIAYATRAPRTSAATATRVVEKSFPALPTTATAAAEAVKFTVTTSAVSTGTRLQLQM